MDQKVKTVGSSRLSCYKWAHNLAHKSVQNEQLKQWMQCMQCELFFGNLVLVDFKRVGPTSSTIDTVGVWGSNPHAPTNVFNKLALTPKFAAAPERSTPSLNNS
jgi:hypothetical protein